jgi:hypothetical protein
MEQGSIWTAISALGAAISAVMAVLAFRAMRSSRGHEDAVRKLREEQVEILRRAEQRIELAQRRAGRADVRATIEWRAVEDQFGVKIGVKALVLRNHGPSVARNVTVRLDGGPVGDHPGFDENRRRADPIEQIDPGKEKGFRYYLAANEDGGEVLVTASWEDDSGEARHLERTVDLSRPEN